MDDFADDPEHESSFDELEARLDELSTRVDGLSASTASIARSTVSGGYCVGGRPRGIRIRARMAASAPTTATSRTPPWLVLGQGCQDRRLSRG
jgi:hypothetical protein